jgi:hypothetical protein
MTVRASRGDRFVYLIFIVMLLLAAGAIGLSVWQNRGLRSQLQACQSETHPVGPPLGSLASPLSVRDSKGANAILEFGKGDRSNLVMFISVDCSFCMEMLPVWKDILSKTSPDRVRAISITAGDTGPLEQLLAQAGVDSPVYRVDANAQVGWRLTATPLTVLVDPSGIASQVMAGVLSDDQIAALVGDLR